MHLHREKVLVEPEEEHELAGKVLSVTEALREEHDLADHLHIGHNHGHSTEQGLGGGGSWKGLGHDLGVGVYFRPGLYLGSGTLRPRRVLLFVFRLGLAEP